MSGKLQDIYRRQCVRAIEQGLAAAVGQPAGVVSDTEAFRRTVIEPGWRLLPAPLQQLGREQLRWDDFLLYLRKTVYFAAEGKAALKSDLPARIERGIEFFFAVKEEAPRATVRAPLVEIPDATDEMTALDVVIGIDLGTTYSVVAHLDPHGRPVSIPNGAGDLITPSVVLFDEENTVVGKEAVQAAALEPDKVAECVKRDMGQPRYHKTVNNEQLPPEVISSLILRALKADAERKLGPVNKAVVTVPAYFDEPRRQATIDAGKLAGLEVLDIINEPTAAAIAYGYQLGFLDPRGKATSDKPLRVLVYDLGGGTFDVTIVEIQGSAFKAIATDGDVSLGGKDWDQKLIDIAAQAFTAQHGQDPRDNPVSLQELWLSAEQAKRTLTERTKAVLYVNHAGTRAKVEVTRPQFE